MEFQAFLHLIITNIGIIRQFEAYNRKTLETTTTTKTKTKTTTKTTRERQADKTEFQRQTNKKRLTGTD